MPKPSISDLASKRLARLKSATSKGVYPTSSGSDLLAKTTTRSARQEAEDDPEVGFIRGQAASITGRKRGGK